MILNVFNLIMKKILFVHQNFPGQFIELAPFLYANGFEVKALTINKSETLKLEGVEIIQYMLNRSTSTNIHPWVSDVESKVIRAECCYKKALELKESGYTPDLIIAHPGWGESLFLKEVWPNSKLGIYCEYYYNPNGADAKFDAEFVLNDQAEACRIRLKNANHLINFEISDGGISPTQWQADTFPRHFREKIKVTHDGIDTQALVPNPNVVINFKNSLGEAISLSKADEVITFVNRNLEPYRGYHVFMRSLPEILRQRQRARVLIVGGDGVSYGAQPKDGKTWKELFIDEVRPKVPDSDWARVHFLGQVPYKHFIPILQLSTVHVYLTYPFVLSWSLLEAMSVGCTILASDTQPVHEVIKHDQTGRLVEFFDTHAITKELCYLLDNPIQRERLGAEARAFVSEYYDLHKVCLPRQLKWVKSLLV